MSPRASASTARAFAGALAAATVVASSPIGAQTLVANTPPGWRDCTQIRDNSAAYECVIENHRARARAAEQGTEDARAEGACAERIKSDIAARRLSAEQLRVALAGRKAREVGACNLLQKLTNG